MKLRPGCRWGLGHWYIGTFISDGRWNSSDGR